jgi:hypothetical protein
MRWTAAESPRAIHLPFGLNDTMVIGFVRPGKEIVVAGFVEERWKMWVAPVEVPSAA